jgi:hypothetical protein
MRKLVLLATLTVAFAGLLVFAGTGLADPPGMLYDPVPPHRHFVLAANGEMKPVGPQICENANLQQAFNQFHHNVHHSAIPSVGVIHTLGPQDGATGLQNGKGAEIRATGC